MRFGEEIQGVNESEGSSNSRRQNWNRMKRGGRPEPVYISFKLAVFSGNHFDGGCCGCYNFSGYIT